MKKIELKPAYLVESWATEIVHGWASSIPMEFDYHSNYRLFTADMKKFKDYSNGVIYFDLPSAEKALKRSKESYKEFCQKQVDEYSEKLKTL